MQLLKVHPITPPKQAMVLVPGSRSITNRALICAALARGESRLRGWLDAEDTQAMRTGLEVLGVQVLQRDGDLVVTGSGGELVLRKSHIDCGASGTTIRFLTGVAGLAAEKVTLTGTPRLRQRPIEPLANAMRSLGAMVETTNGFPPVHVHSGELHGGTVSIDAEDSGQFVSSVLLVSPYAAGPVEILAQSIVSRPFVDMTIDVMRSFGVQVDQREPHRFRVVQTGGYVASDHVIEPDAMSASYFFAAAALTGGSVIVKGLGGSSIQGDVEFVSVLERMGCTVEKSEIGVLVAGPSRLQGIDVDLNAMPDMALTLAVVACFAEGPTRIRGIRHLRHKESDRLAALENELRKLGAGVTLRASELEIEPPLVVRPARIATYDDHRMAMSFAIAGLQVNGVVIENPKCVAKTYPAFFNDLEQLKSEI